MFVLECLCWSGSRETIFSIYNCSTEVFRVHIQKEQLGVLYIAFNVLLIAHDCEVVKYIISVGIPEETKHWSCKIKFSSSIFQLCSTPLYAFTKRVPPHHSNVKIQMPLIITLMR